MIGSFFSWANIKGALGSKSVVLYRCSGCMFDAVVTPFLALTSCPSCSLLLLELSFFPFVNITRSEMEFCFLFFVVEGAVNF